MVLNPKQRFRKTAILTSQGLQKLEAAKLKANLSPSPTLEVLNEHTGLSSHTLSKIHIGRVAVDLRTLERYFRAFKLTLEPTDYREPMKSKPLSSLNMPYQDELLNSKQVLSNELLVKAPKRCSAIVNWGTAPDVSAFCGRSAELTILRHWILAQPCRLIALAGMGGIGKTWLATKLAEQLQQEFEFVIWRSLQPLSRSHPSLPFDHFLDDLISYLSCHRAPSEPAATGFRHLADLLSRRRCLLIIDNIESVLDNHNADAYKNLIRYFAIGRHQSCVVLTSRVEPYLPSFIAGNPPNNRSLVVQGLSTTEIQQIVGSSKPLQGTTGDWNQLVNYYSGNPQILNMVAKTIQHLFDGSITDFLSHNVLIFDDLREWLDQHIKGVSNYEQEVINALANQNTPLSLSDLQRHTSPAFSRRDLLESLKSLNAKSIIEQTAASFYLSGVFFTYAKESLVKNSG
jgi:NACHT domain